MTEKEFSRTSRILYDNAVAIASMIYSFLAILIEMGIFALGWIEDLSRTAQKMLTIPKELVIGFGLVFGILVLTECFLSEDYHHELCRIRKEIEKDAEFDLRFQEDSILDSLDVLTGWCQPLVYLRSFRWDIRQAAAYRGVKIPAGDRLVVLFLGVPMLICGLLFTHQVTGIQQRQEALVNRTRTYIEELAQKIEPVCDQLEWETYEGHEELGYDENMYLNAEFKKEFCPQGAAMHFQLDESCRLECLSFDLYIDPEASREEMLRQCQSNLSLLYSFYADGNFAEKDLYFQEMWRLPEDFCDQFLSDEWYPVILYHAREKYPQVNFSYERDAEGNLLEGAYISIFLYSF